MADYQISFTAKELDERLGAVDTKLEGFSSKYNISKKGWHRVLNTIRGNGGTLVLTLTDGFQLQTVNIDMSGYVKWVSSRDSFINWEVSGSENAPITNPIDWGLLKGIQAPDFVQSSYKLLRSSPQQSDDYFLHKITKVRIGYPSQEALKTKFDPEVSVGLPINCYVDIYVDFNRIPYFDSEKKKWVNTKAFTCQFTGKANQHNCYNITEATTDENYAVVIGNDIMAKGTKIDLSKGMYGEELEFYAITINSSFEENAPDKVVRNKKIYADDLFIKTEDSYAKINEPHCIGKHPIRLHLWNSHIGGDLSCDFRFVRKYNWLNLHNASNGSSIDYTFSSMVDGHRVIVPNKCKHGTISGLNYNITKSGAFIFHGEYTGGTPANLNVFYANTKEDAIYLPKGKYLVGGLYSIFYRGMSFESKDTELLIKPNGVNPYCIGDGAGSTTGNSQTLIDIPADCYLTFARMKVKYGLSTITNDASNCFVEVPFLIKVPDDCSNSLLLTYFANFAPTGKAFLNDEQGSGITYENNKLVYNGNNDFIVIQDGVEVLATIDSWTDFYSSEYAHGIKAQGSIPSNEHENFDTGFEERSASVMTGYLGTAWKYEVMGTNAPIVDVYRMYNDSNCVNYYDTLLMPQADGNVENASYTSVKEILKKLANKAGVPF